MQTFMKQKISQRVMLLIKATKMELLEFEMNNYFGGKREISSREFVRFYQDVILHEIINENNEMKRRLINW